MKQIIITLTAGLLTLAPRSIQADQTNLGPFPISLPLACKFFVPNAFSPNEDGQNDIFVPGFGADCTLATYNLRVFNRWGTLVFESLAQETGWDGEFRNQPAPQGVYLYSIQYTLEGDGDSDIQIQSGEVSLLR
ncbi:MAG: gliding motility-associated C-terminal domain-containing protein [Haliscomenobacter sp.]|nr:gliding motility-associated C-terminal domain-containing protein [Haliscomenobacter sp.]MBK8878820.1 gliding motility-associated C-terminal domain-containing protein [Haliscomenobacter sp.]